MIPNLSCRPGDMVSTMNHVAPSRRIIYPVAGFDFCSFFESGRWGKVIVSGWVVSRPAGPRLRLTPPSTGDEIPLAD